MGKFTWQRWGPLPDSNPCGFGDPAGRDSFFSIATGWILSYLSSWAFGRVARSIAQGHGFGNPLADTGPSALLPSIYCTARGIFKIFGIYTRASIIAALVLNSLFSAFTCVPVYRIAERCFGSRVAKWACWGWALSPYGIYYGADWAWSTCLVTLLLAWLFLMTIELENSDKLLDWSRFGFWSGFAVLVEPVVLSVLPLLGAWTLYRARKQGRPLLAPKASFCRDCGDLGCLTVDARFSIFHKFIPVRSGFGLELYIGNNGDSQHWVNRNLHPNHSDQELNSMQRGESLLMDHKKEQAFAFIKSSRMVCRDDDTPGALPVGQAIGVSRLAISPRNL